MFAGKPILAGDCKPIERIVNDTQSGYIYTSDRPDELANILRHLGEDKPGIFGVNGKKWVEKKYNWSFDSKVLQDLYRYDKLY